MVETQTISEISQIQKTNTPISNIKWWISSSKINTTSRIDIPSYEESKKECKNKGMEEEIIKIWRMYWAWKDHPEKDKNLKPIAVISSTEGSIFIMMNQYTQILEKGMFQKRKAELIIKMKASLKGQKCYDKWKA